VAGMNWSAHAKEFLEADLVVINGEGALHHDRPIVQGVLDLASRRKELSLPTALVNTSWFANSPANTCRLAAFDLIALRDPLSRRELAQFGLDSLDAPDLAIREACNFPATEIIPGGRFIASDSTQTEITILLRDMAKKRGWDYLPILYTPVRARPGKKSQKIWTKILVAQTLGPLAKYFMPPRYHAHLAGSPSLLSYMDALRQSRGVLTGRFHTTCFCIGLGVPFVAIRSNTDKIRGLLLDAGLDPDRRMIPANSLETIGDIPPFSNVEIEALADFRRESETRYRKLFTAIRNLIPANS
jgi:hypothetical protein